MLSNVSEMLSSVSGMLAKVRNFILTRSCTEEGARRGTEFFISFVFPRASRIHTGGIRCIAVGVRGGGGRS